MLVTEEFELNSNSLLGLLKFLIPEKSDLFHFHTLLEIFSYCICKKFKEAPSKFMLYELKVGALVNWQGVTSLFSKFLLLENNIRHNLVTKGINFKC